MISLGVLCGCDRPSPSRSPSPYLVELLENPSFEDAESPWVPSGCTRSQGHGDIQPQNGLWMLLGGRGDCAAVQSVDLLDHGVLASEIDAGHVGVNASGWMIRRMRDGTYDDQAFIRIHYNDANHQHIATLQGLLGGDRVWTMQPLLGAVPPNTRHIAVEVGGVYRHGQFNEAAVDNISLMLEQRTATPANITLSPMLQDVRTTHMRVLWETDRIDTPARLEWGTTADHLTAHDTPITTTQIAASRYLHQGEITGLSPESRVHYRACVGEVCTQTAAFDTAPNPGTSLRVGWLADNQDDIANLFATHLSHLHARDPNLVIMAGDIVQNGDVLEEWSKLWWEPIAASGLGAQVPVMIARGNHDKEYAYAYAYTAMPGNGAWYSFQYGDVFFVVLDSNFSAAHVEPVQDQVGYLRRTLASDDAQNAAYRVVVFHAAPFNSVQTSRDPERNSWGWEHAQQELVPILEENRVELVVSGHYHTYQRGERGPTKYVVIGGGGASLLGQRVGGPFEDMWAHIESVYHYAVMDVDQNGLHWRTYNAKDEQIDQFTIPPPARP